jgi:hypothetical protein
MILEGDCYEGEVTSYLELLVTFGISLEGVCHVLDAKFEGISCD